MTMTLDRVVPCALHQAHEKLRACQHGDFDHAAKIHERMFDTLCQSEVPNIALAIIARKLGRDRALQVGIERGVVEAAIRRPEFKV